MTNERRNLIASLLVLGLSVAYLAWAMSYPVKVRGVPVLVGVVTCVLGLIDVVAHSGTPFGRTVAGLVSGRAHLEAEDDLRLVRAEWSSILWMAIALATVLLFGFIIAVPIYVFGYMRLQGGFRLPLSLWIAGGTTLFCWGVFEMLLDFPLYRGMLFES